MKVTIKELERLVKLLNQLTGNATEPHSKVDGKIIANVGNYHLDCAYGGYKLVKLVDDKGTTTAVIQTGHTTKKILYFAIQHFMSGMRV